MKKLLVLGNCQARPLGRILHQFAGFDLLDPIILHLAKDQDRQADEQKLASADLIVTQLTANVFRPEHLRSNVIKDRFFDKAIIWPNLFFAGQQPYLRYITSNTLGRILGPLDAIHDLRILRDWFQSRAGIAFQDHIVTEGYEQRVAERSLIELRQREAACDVMITDLIEANMTTRRLFFTFNHPSVWLLSRLAERILAHIGDPQLIDDTALGESLGAYQPPSTLPALSDPIHGVEVKLDTPGRIGVGLRRHYSPDELKQTAFACYDHIGDKLQPATLRVTPAY